MKEVEPWMCWAPGYGPLPVRVASARDVVETARERLRTSADVEWVSAAGDAFREVLAGRVDQLRLTANVMGRLEGAVRQHVTAVEAAQARIADNVPPEMTDTWEKAMGGYLS